MKDGNSTTKSPWTFGTTNTKLQKVKFIRKPCMMPSRKQRKVEGSAHRVFMFAKCTSSVHQVYIADRNQVKCNKIHKFVFLDLHVVWWITSSMSWQFYYQKKMDLFYWWSRTSNLMQALKHLFYNLWQLYYYYQSFCDGYEFEIEES